MTRRLLLLLATVLAVAEGTSAQDDADALTKGLPLIEHSLPDAGGGPVEVRIGLFVIDIKEIDDVHQTVVADYLLATQWHDPRLVHDGSTESGVRTFNEGEIWTPFVQVRNIQRVFPQLPLRISVDADGVCQQLNRYVGTLSVPLALRDFPFDSQVLSFVAVSPGHTVEEVNLVVDHRFSGRSEALTIVDWDIGPGAFEAEPVTLRSDGVAMSAMRASFPARRYTNYFVIKIIVPLIVIILMSWAVFWVNPAQFGPRVSVGVTSLLTLIAYRFMLGSLVPRVSYLTRLDIFIFGATLLVFFALLETLLGHALLERERAGTAKLSDRVSRVLFPATFTALMLIAFVF